jgi:signal transduction histidine kinase
LFKKLLYNSAYSHKSIVRDLLLWLIVLVLVTASITAIGYVSFAKYTASVEMNKRADGLIIELSSMLSVPLYNIDYEGVLHISKIFLRIPDVIGIYVEDEQGEVVIDTIAQKESGFVREANVSKGDLYIGSVHLMLSSDSHKRHQRLTLLTIFWAGLILICVMVVGMHTIMEFILIRPLGRFNRRLFQIAEGDYSTRLPPVKHVDLNGSVTAVNSMATKIEKVIDEVSLTRDFLQNVLDSMPSILIVVDRGGRVNSMNMAAGKLVKSYDKCIGEPVVDIFPVLGKDIEEHISLAINRGETVTIFQKKCPSLGKNKSAEITIYPLRASVTGGAVIRVDDITARIRLQKVMIHTEKMLSVGGLGAGMAHEINNPLGGILQATQNIERRLSPELQKNIDVASGCGFKMDELIQYMEEREIFMMLTGIRDSGHRAAKIVQNMLQFSRSNDTAMESCVVAELLDRVIELAKNDYDLTRKYDFKGFTVIRNYRHDISMYCSKTGVEQVFLNLMKNAAQACSTVDAPPQITINVIEDEDSVSVEIIDNGHGMDETTQKRIFEPFFTTKQVGEGTGLGLAVSYFIIVDQHKGHLRVDSEAGEGATFTVQLPKI